MNTGIREKAERILRDAEASIRGLISEAANDRRYDEIEWLLQLGRRLAALATPDTARAVGSSSARDVAKEARSEKPKTLRPGQKAARRYPIYSTTEERLIKIGWSKKNRAEYEHRAPKASIQIISEAIKAKRNSGGDAFEAESLMPLLTEDGQEVPAYQVYMAIGWLRDLGALDKDGRNKYRLKDHSLAFDVCWERTRSVA
jgi:hypothetical protein